MVKTEENPKRRVEKFVKLTPKGELFIRELENICMGNAKEVDILALGASPNKQRHLDKMQARQDEQRAKAQEREANA